MITPVIHVAETAAGFKLVLSVPFNLKFINGIVSKIKAKVEPGFSDKEP